MNKTLVLGALLGEGVSLLNKERRQKMASGASQPGKAQSSGGAAGMMSGAGATAGIGMLAGVAEKVFGQMQSKSPGAAGAAGGVLGKLFGKGSGQPAQQAAPTGATGGNAAPVDEGQADLLLKAMVAAAQSDGQIEPDEQKKITEFLSAEGHVDSSEQDELKQLFSQPVDIKSVLSQVKDPDTALKVYTVSAMTINPDKPREKQYIDQLASKLGISEQAVQAVQQHLPKAA